MSYISDIGMSPHLHKERAPLMFFTWNIFSFEQSAKIPHCFDHKVSASWGPLYRLPMFGDPRVHPGSISGRTAFTFKLWQFRQVRQQVALSYAGWPTVARVLREGIGSALIQAKPSAAQAVPGSTGKYSAKAVSKRNQAKGLLQGWCEKKHPQNIRPHQVCVCVSVCIAALVQLPAFVSLLE